MTRTRKGFTLIELLIVIAVIGILASAVLVGLGPVQRSGRDARRASDLRQTQNALELYSNRYGCYPFQASQSCTPLPLSAQALAWGPCSPATGLCAALTGGTTPIVSVVPQDPRTGATYYYGYAAQAIGYVLGANLEDTASPLYNADVDGTVYTIDCGSGGTNGDQTNPRYCVQL